MTIEAKVKNPILTLYAFHLWADFDEGYQTKAKNAQAFWYNFAKEVGKELKSEELQNFPEKLTKTIPKDENWENLLLLPDGKRKLPLSPIPIAENLMRKGAFRAEKIQDTYAVELTLSCQEKDTPINPRDLKAFNPNGCLLQSTIKASLGQTILLYAEPNIFVDYRTLADACVAGLVDSKINPSPKFISQGKLFGSPIFEYDNRELNPELNCHILVLLKQNPNTLDSFNPEFDISLKNLLFYRRKVLYAYYRAKVYYGDGQKQASDLEKQIPKFSDIEKEPALEKRLTELKDLLANIRKSGFEYSKSLRFVRECHNTTTTNIENFKNALKEVDPVKLDDDNLEIWYRFSDLASNTYLKQIEVDLNYLIAGQNLFQEMIANIRGMLEIEQIETDRKSSEKDTISSRNLNITIAVVGGGMAAAGIVATSYGLIKPEQPLLMPWDKNAGSLHPFTQSVFWSLLIGLIPVLLWALIWFFVLRKHKVVGAGSPKSDRKNDESTKPAP
ncbi:hypothetical protein [Kamptonema sp. UHCC 0994]|uniref:hypothetical protein n=1 Tax=Kamptonema sp. UHCC 0994 TaxID=3031329 RepID=UPI0023BAA972|nr:hypothetical protein [Kamptonema sp. UHCC 0994]MDF0556147.1 hypothetical protein [Kamptonema sp. UHCC 0994]